MTQASAQESALTPLVRLVDVHKSFGALEVLRGISMEVKQGDAVCMIGPSGSGKSTLLRCINGLIPVNSGEIFVGAHAVHSLATDAEMIALRKDVSIVFLGWIRPLRESIALAYIPAALAEHTDSFEVEILGERRRAQRVAHALYDPPGERMRAS
jgi:ABC-type histidine transport system ATPase subunit